MYPHQDLWWHLDELRKYATRGFTYAYLNTTMQWNCTHYLIICSFKFKDYNLSGLCGDFMCIIVFIWSYHGSTILWQYNGICNKTDKCLFCLCRRECHLFGAWSATSAFPQQMASNGIKAATEVFFHTHAQFVARVSLDQQISKITSVSIQAKDYSVQCVLVHLDPVLDIKDILKTLTTYKTYLK